jgi:hypothetical protein
MLTRPFFLLKFGEKRFIDQFFHEGKICFSSIHKFRDDQTPGRGDKLEGTTLIENIGNGVTSVKIDGVWKRLPFQKAHYREFSNGPLGNCLSLYCLNSQTIGKKDIHKIDKRMLEFGDQCVFIYNVTDFLERVEIALQKKNYNYRGKVVAYKNFNKKRVLHADPFIKHFSLSYQHEYRIWLIDCFEEREFIEIGSLDGLANLIPAAEFIEHHRATTDTGLEKLLDTKNT